MKKATKEALWTTLVVVIGVLVLLVMTRNQIIRNVSRRVIRQSTGFDIEMGGVRVGLWRPSFELLNTKLLNPEDFRESDALDIRRIYVRYDPRSLFSDAVRLPEVYIDVPRIVVVVKEDGEMNLQRLGRVAAEKPVREPPAGGKGEQREEEATAAGEAREAVASRKPEKTAKNVHIDTLTVKLGAASMRSYAGGRDKPQVVDIPIGVDRTFQNVTNLEEVVTVLSSEILIRTVPTLAQGLSRVYEENEEALKASGAALEAEAKALEKVAKGLLDR